MYNHASMFVRAKQEEEKSENTVSQKTESVTSQKTESVQASAGDVKGKILDGWQLRYLYFIYPEYRKRLTVPIIPFSRINEIGAGMYKGEKR